MRNAIIIALVLCSNLCIAQKLSLQLNLEKGMDYAQSTNGVATITQDIMGQEMKIVTTITGKMTYTVTDIIPEGYRMDVSYNSLGISMEMAGNSVEFSSEEVKEGDVLSMTLSKMKEKPFQITMTKYGRVTQIDNLETLYESALEEFPDMDPSQLEQARQQLQKSYGEKAFKGNIEMATAIYPTQKVKPGDVWVVDTKLESGMSMNLSTTYSLVDQTDDYYLISGQSILESTDKDSFQDSNGISMRFDMSGTMTSNIKIDKNSGWIQEATVNQDLKGDAHVKESPELPDGLTIPMTLSNELNYTNQ